MRPLAIATITTVLVQAQSWAARQGGSNTQQTRAVAADKQGNVYVSGYSTSSMFIAYDASGCNISKFPIRGSTGAFVIKYTPDGSFSWMAMQDGVGTDYANSLSTDFDGSVFVGGSFSSTLSVYDSSSAIVRTLVSNGQSASHLIKYASNGSVFWATRQDSTGADQTNTVSTNNQGEVYIGGQFQSSLSIYSSQDVFAQSLSQPGSDSGFLIKYAGNGSFIWAVKVESFTTAIIQSCSVDQNGDVLVAGYYQTGSARVFDGGGANVKTLALNSGSGFGSFAVKYNSNGSFIWATRQDGTQDDQGQSISTSASLVYVIVQMQGFSTAIYDSRNNFIKTISTAGSTSGFIITYYYNGSFAWAVRHGGPSISIPYGSSVDVPGNIIITGRYNSDLTIYNQLDNAVSSLPVSGSQGVFVIKFYSNSSFAWNSRVDGLGYEWSCGVNSDSMGNVQVVGYCTSDLLIYDALGQQANQTVPKDGVWGGYVLQFDRNGMWNGLPDAGNKTCGSMLTINDNSIPGSLIGTVSQTSSSLSVASATEASASSTLADKSSRTLSTSTTIMPVTSVSSTVIVSLSEDPIQLFYSLQGGKFSSATIQDLPDLEFEKAPVQSASFDLIIILAAGLIAMSLILVMLAYCLCRLRKSKLVGLITTESLNTTEMGPTTNLTTMMVTSHVLAVPQFLVLQFGVDIRQLEQIARGGGGSINRCQVLDQSKLPNYDRSELVIKSLGKDADQLTDLFRRSFYQEIGMLYMFRDQPYFAKMFGFTEKPATIVLKFYELGSLLQFILGKNVKSTKFRYTKRQVLLLQVKLGQGLAFMHSNSFAHCDIKPDNVLLEQVGQRLQPRITDFGISRLLEKSAAQVQAFQLSKIRGASIRYAAPEVIIRFRQQMPSDPDVWKAGDVYAMSILCWEMLTREQVWSLPGKY